MNRKFLILKNEHTFYKQTVQSGKERREFLRFVAKKCSSGHSKRIWIDCTSAIGSPPAFGMNVFDWRKAIFSNTAAGSSKWNIGERGSYGFTKSQ
jgi:hypothetical protein